MSDAINTWKSIKYVHVAVKHQGKFLSSMAKLRQHKALVACLPWTAVCNEKRILFNNKITEGRHSQAYVHLQWASVKKESPSLALCTPADLEELQTKIVREMMRATLGHLAKRRRAQEDLRPRTISSTIFSGTKIESQACSPLPPCRPWSWT